MGHPPVFSAYKQRDKIFSLLEQKIRQGSDEDAASII